jgi:hypothetical protein
MTSSPQGIREEEQAWQELAGLLETFLLPRRAYLDPLLDKRLVRTLVQGCLAIGALAHYQTRPALRVNWDHFSTALMASAKRPVPSPSGSEP